ncbi:MAG: hypothetical protein JXP34_03640, partial [Planctomycetes bacterium]|nr:hypothetical protein [Planctomycetota bacterium]
MESVRSILIAGAIAAGAIIGFSGSARGGAGPADFAARLVPAEASAPAGAQATLTAAFDFKTYDVQGFSLGICTGDGSIARAVAATIDGTATATAKAGAKPDFVKVNVLAAGVTLGIVVDFLGEVKIPPADDFTAVKVTYDVLGEFDTCTDIAVCDTLGSPPVQTVVVVEGVSIKPAAIGNAKICSRTNGDPGINLHLVPRDGKLKADTFDAEEVAVFVESWWSVDLQGWSYGVSHDAANLRLVEIKGGPVIMATNGGDGPDFHALDIHPDPGPGGTVACVISLEPPFEEIPLAEDAAVTLETFVYVSAEHICCDVPECPPETTAAAFSDALGTPPFDIVFVVEGLSVDPSAGMGAVLTLMKPYCPPPGYVRGDANADRRVDIADGVWILNELFLPDRYPTNRSKCLDATDANADGQIDASDAISIFCYQLLDGPQPPPPFPACGFVEPI